MYAGIVMQLSNAAAVASRAGALNGAVVNCSISCHLAVQDRFRAATAVGRLQRQRHSTMHQTATNGAN